MLDRELPVGRSESLPNFRSPKRNPSLVGVADGQCEALEGSRPVPQICRMIYPLQRAWFAIWWWRLGLTVTAIIGVEKEV